MGVYYPECFDFVILNGLSIGLENNDSLIKLENINVNDRKLFIFKSQNIEACYGDGK